MAYIFLFVYQSEKSTHGSGPYEAGASRRVTRTVQSVGFKFHLIGGKISHHVNKPSLKRG